MNKLMETGIITGSEYDCRFLSDMIAKGFTQTGKVEDGYACHPFMAGKPYLQKDKIILSPAINLANVAVNQLYDYCDCGGEMYEDSQGISCVECGAIHADCS